MEKFFILFLRFHFKGKVI